MITSGSGLWLSCQSGCFQYHSFAVRIQYSAKISTAKCWKDVNKEKEVGLWPISKTPSQSIKASLEIAFFLSEFWPSSESVKSFWQKTLWVLFAFEHEVARMKIAFDLLAHQSYLEITFLTSHCRLLLDPPMLMSSVTRKKSPNVYKSCPKMISLEK